MAYIGQTAQTYAQQHRKNIGPSLDRHASFDEAAGTYMSAALDIPHDKGLGYHSSKCNAFNTQDSHCYSHYYTQPQHKSRVSNPLLATSSGK